MTPPADTSASAAMLRSVGLRCTPVRVGVLDVLATAGHPMAMADVLAQLPEHTDAVTTYRTLNTFTHEQLVHRVRGEDRTWRYALTTSAGRPAAGTGAPHAHAHFVCDECGQVECLKAARIPDGLVESLRVGRQYAVRYPEVLLHGVCPKCR